FSAGFDVPQFVRYQGVAIPQVAGIPTAPNQWGYDATTDTLYLWLPDGSDPHATPDAVSVFDWRPLMEEMIQVFFDGPGWTWRRLAHHRTQSTGVFSATPRGNADPTGSFMLFKSNWDNTLRNADGAYREDVFLVLVPPLGSVSNATSSGASSSPSITIPDEG